MIELSQLRAVHNPLGGFMTIEVTISVAVEAIECLAPGTWLKPEDQTEQPCCEVACISGNVLIVSESREDILLLSISL